MKHIYLSPINLCLFEGGTAAGSEGGATGDTTGSPANTQQENTGDLRKVRYGKQTDSTGTPAAEVTEGGAKAPDTLAERQKKFDELIASDEFKDIYTQKTQDMINRRFSKAKAAEAENGKLREIASLLSSKYDIDLSADADFSKLRAAVEGDSDIWSAAAEEAGMSVEQYREFDRMRRENEAYAAAKQNDIKAEQDRQRAESWQREAIALKEKYPQFDLKAELADRNFVAAINAGVPMAMVYQGKYYDSLSAESAVVTAKTTEEKLISNIRAKGNRPAENGASQKGAAFTVKSDPSKLSIADFDEIARRVRNGEQIVF